ncbi:Potassium uptake protein TrkH [Paramagnetospirillum magnetotacticum MS-1]|uniref:Trk system potassium uptake protein n=1 Tax=Paramagnetospirillum magnetotacticum MS-1 TaxID=272627 RepID=A0A0C2UXK6_PARME|nr:TrkH family potassium uptake protein [Paramagnetospirillum magnetotacticum]KIL97551.1 Potassium uptake protein TrkH [Paramagnetospirillum magnetotacticum MS-1]
MIDIRPVLSIVGTLVCILAAAMWLPAVIDFRDGHEEWRVFATSSGMTLFFGLALLLGTRTPQQKRSVRQTYLSATFGFAVPALFAALPLIYGPLQLSVMDAVFEATAGLTTTSATVIKGLDVLPRGLLLWRALLGWLGGIGVIALAIAVLPDLAVGGMQMFRVEVPGPAERATSRGRRIALSILAGYCGATGLLALALWVAGMSGFEALVHAMGTISTSGASTSDASIGHFDSGAITVLITFGMILGGMPFLLFFHFLRGNRKVVLRDHQLRWYFALLALGTLGVSSWLVTSRGLAPLDALRHGALTVVSVMTGTGHFTLEYGNWGGMPAAILFFLAFVGGCAGSTSGGIKVFRFQFLFADALMQIRRLLRPHAVLIATFNRRTIPEGVLGSVMGFLFVYALSFAMLAMSLAFLGLDFVTAVSGAASALANLGPGLGPEIGPGGSYAGLPDLAKALLCLGMLVGRLELFTVLVLFVPAFWRQ